MNDTRRNRIIEVLNNRQPDITVILENITDPHNITAVMRTSDSVGIQDIYIINYPNGIPTKKWGYRSSAGTHKWLNLHYYDAVAPCIAAIRQQYDQVYATFLSDEATDLYEMDFTQKIALVFGNERLGCSDEIVAAADGTMKIPQAGIVQSLNISVACAVTLYEAFRQKRMAGHYNEPRLGVEQRHQLQAKWGDYDMVRQLSE